MFKRDAIFYAAAVLCCLGVGLVVAGSEFSLLLFVAAYLLRPALHEFGLVKRLADERQLNIHSRSGDIGFIVVILAAVGYLLLRVSRGEGPGELYELIFIGLAGRALAGLVMNGEFRKAGVVIISVIGVFLTLFVVAEGGLSVQSLFGVVLGAIILGFGQLARRLPRTMAVVLAVLALGAILFFDMYEFRRASAGLWLLLVAPLATASACLLLGSGDPDRQISPTLRTSVFGVLGAGALVVFTMVLVYGGRELPVTSQSLAAPEGEIVEVQGVSCVGSVEHSQDGKLVCCTLGREDTLSGQPLPAGTVVYLTPDGSLDWCFLQQNTLIQDHLCSGSGHNFMTCFHPNGQLKMAWLARDEVIQGIPCAKFRFMSSLFGGGDCTTFYENGQLRYCKLSKEFTIEGRDFRRGAEVRFDETGKLKVLTP